MAWTKVEVSQEGQDFRARYIDSDNQVLEAIDFCRTKKGRILIFTLWDADFPEERQAKVWDLIVTAGLDKTNEVMGPTITSNSAEKREKFLAIIFALGKFELQTKREICEKFEFSFDKIENISSTVYADSDQEILGSDSEFALEVSEGDSLSDLSDSTHDISIRSFGDLFRTSSPAFFQDNLSSSSNSPLSVCEESESSDSEEEIASDNEKRLNLSNSSSPFRRSPVRG